MKKQRSIDPWNIVSIAIFLIILLTIAQFWYQGSSGGYPSVFVYREHRYTDDSTEALILEIVETFNYTCIPVNQPYILRDVYLNQSRLNHLANLDQHHNRLLDTGYDIYHYIANVTPYNTLTVNLTTESNDYWVTPFSNITTGTERVYPLEWEDTAIWRASAAYLNTSHYENIQRPLNLTYTNVYLVDMQLWHTWHRGLLAHECPLEQQQVIVNEIGTILFLYWAVGYTCPFA